MVLWLVCLFCSNSVDRWVKKKVKKNIPFGVAHINSTFNNTIITITDTTGNTVSWSSSGNKGFKGSRKSTPFAAQLAAEEAGKKAIEHGMKNIEIIICSRKTQWCHDEFGKK